MNVDDIDIHQPTDLELHRVAIKASPELIDQAGDSDIDTGTLFDNIDFFYGFVAIHTDFTTDEVKELPATTVFGLVERCAESYGSPMKTELFGGVEVYSDGRVTLK